MALQPTTKRVTLDLDMRGHKKLREAAKMFDLTQQELLVLVVELTLTNPETIRAHAERYKRRKEAEEARKEDMNKKAKMLLEQLTPEQQAKLLSGNVNLASLI